MATQEELKKFSGEWVLLFDDQIVDHSVNIEDMLKVADEKFAQNNLAEERIKISRIPQGTPRESILQ